MDDLDDDYMSSSSSSMDVSSSVASSPKLPSSPKASLHAGSKRSPPGSPSMNPDQKKRKLVADGADKGKPSASVELPEYIWQQVFLHLSPTMLCRFLSVSKTFNKYLTATKASQPSQRGRSKKLLLDSETIWMQTRKVFFPVLPRPLARCTELQMLQLIGGKLCQICHRQPVPSPATNPFNSGPGAEGTRVIWPFGIRTCGRCLESVTQKDVEVLLTAASTLRSGLAYAFLTADQHFVPENQRSAPGGIPSNLLVSKIYLKKDIKEILEEYEDAQGFGFGAAEEWRKGLAAKGRAAMVDASRWEKWESQHRHSSNLSLVLREYDLTSFPLYSAEVKRQAAAADSTPPAAPAHGIASLPPKPVLPGRVPFSQPQTYYNSAPGTRHSYPPPPGVGHPLGPPPGLTAPPSQTPKTPAEAESAARSRRAEIERRCAEIMPPLDVAVLPLMPCFQAAILITRPLTDHDWEILEPKIQSEREAAEWLEHQRAQQRALLQAAVPVPYERPKAKQSREAKEHFQHTYNKAQDPLRKRLAQYVEEFLTKSQWREQKHHHAEEYPELCARTIMHVKERYDEEKKAGTLPSPRGKSHPTAQRDHTPEEPFLSLENMKWVFENKIKPLTDRHRQELFICADCEVIDNTPNWFVFESLVQHYGAKHTDEFSQGNVVVSWPHAEWPGDPPFHTDPGVYLRRPQIKTPKQRAPKAERPSPVYRHTEQGHNSQSDTDVDNLIKEDNTIAQVNTFATEAHAFWSLVDDVKDMMDCVKVQVVLHHAGLAFQKTYHEILPMDTVTEALATSELMKPIKSAQGLACKACVATQPDEEMRHASYYARVSKVRLYNLSTLLNHFKIVHRDAHFPLPGTPPPNPGNIIELPDNKMIGTLIRAQGMDDQKLALVAAVFRDAFPYPLPPVGSMQKTSSEQGLNPGSVTRLLDRLDKPKKSKKKNKKSKGNQGQDGEAYSGREDEYDPRRPMFASGKDTTANDAARFDSDIARRSESVPAHQNADGAHAMPTKLISASDELHRDLSKSAQSQAQADNRSERSPSVGRASSAAQPALPAAKQPIHTSAATTPDIAALLASLKGQTLPPAQNVRQAPQTHTPTYETPPAQRPGQASYSHERPASSQFAPHSSATPITFAAPAVNPGSDIEAALLRSNRQYEHPQYARPQQQSPAYPVYQDHRPSPMEYRPVYAEARPPTNPASAPYHAGPEVQYIQLPPDVPSHHQHQYPQQPQYYAQPPQQQQYHHPPPQRQLYVDEHGRTIELIPVESAPHHQQYGAPPGPGPEVYSSYAPVPVSVPGGVQHAYYDHGYAREGTHHGRG